MHKQLTPFTTVFHGGEFPSVCVPNFSYQYFIQLHVYHKEYIQPIFGRQMTLITWTFGYYKHHDFYHAHSGIYIRLKGLFRYSHTYLTLLGPFRYFQCPFRSIPVFQCTRSASTHVHVREPSLFFPYFLISKNRAYFLISKNDFLISGIRFFDIRKLFFDIRKSISWYQKIVNIFWYQEIEFLISKNRFSDIKNSFCDIKKSIFWYQKILFISWYQEIDFLISKIRFFWYQEFEYLI